MPGEVLTRGCCAWACRRLWRHLSAGVFGLNSLPLRGGCLGGFSVRIALLRLLRPSLPSGPTHACGFQTGRPESGCGSVPYSMNLKRRKNHHWTLATCSGLSSFCGGGPAPFSVRLRMMRSVGVRRWLSWMLCAHCSIGVQRSHLAGTRLALCSLQPNFFELWIAQRC